MADSVSFLMAMHCHQPVGNFDFVFEQAYRKAYEPFVAALERHPGIRVSLHYSGGLVDWFEAHQPAFVERIRRLVARSQVELLGSGYYEPILPLIPEADREGQLRLMQQRLRRLFGAAASGVWLTERVWEPELPASLARAGVEFAMLDTNQFQASRPYLPGELQQADDEFWDLLGSYTTDYAGAPVVLFPMSKRLRYWIPFQDPSRTIDFLRRAARATPLAVTYADDGEKFGLWPKTFEWVYEHGWLERFFAAIERESSWLVTSTFSQYRASTGTNGRVYLPCGSYEEMLEWSHGYFRNFFVKYPESDAMYQKMLTISRALQAIRAQGGATGKAATPLDQAQRELYMAQCNDAYWHGVFGGLYLGNLRRVVYEHLLRAESLLRRIQGAAPAVTSADLDGDGRAEVALQTDQLSVVVDPDDLGAVTEWAYYPKAMNLSDTLTRRAEPYHEKLKAKQLAGVAGGQPQTIHGALRVKEEGLEAHLTYDDHRRVSFRDHALGVMPTLEAIRRSTWAEQRLWSGGAWDVEGCAETARGSLGLVLSRAAQQGRITKSVAVDRKQPRVTFGLELADVEAPVVALEFNLGVRDERWVAPRWQDGVREFAITDASFGVTLAVRLERPAAVASFPIETISDSEEGLERTYQGLAVVCLWQPGGARPWSTAMTWTIGA